MSFSNQDFETGRPGTVAAFDQPERSGPEGSFSVIDQFSTFDGTFVAERDLRVDGNVKGTIECKGTLFVAQGATVNARVEAENITVAGQLTGEIDCTGRLRLLPSGRLKGKVKTRGFVIAEGAIYDGDLVMKSNSSAPTAAGSQSGSEAQAPLEPASPRRQSESTRRASSKPAASQRRPAEPGTDVAPTAPSTFVRRLGGQETPWEGQPDEEPTAEVERTES